MSRSFPIFLGTLRGTSIEAFWNDTRSEEPPISFVIQHDHKSFGSIYGVSFVVMILPLLTIIALIALFSRYRLKSHADQSCCLVSCCFGNSIKNIEGSEKKAYLGPNRLRKTIKTRKPMIFNNRHGVIRYLQQDRLPFNDISMHHNDNFSEYTDKYDCLPQAVERDSEDDEEIDYQKQDSTLHSPPYFYLSSFLTARMLLPKPWQSVDTG